MYLTCKVQGDLQLQNMLLPSLYLVVSHLCQDERLDIQPL